ncbi:MAG: hypothetical protein J3Q66DRAFT_405833 [Benniella sp.]|nr:MAG: hypothetical protein J3Q66DRAFT_405833 [Benniella sp.]
MEYNNPMHFWKASNRLGIHAFFKQKHVGIWSFDAFTSFYRSSNPLQSTSSHAQMDSSTQEDSEMNRIRQAWMRDLRVIKKNEWSPSNVRLFASSLLPSQSESESSDDTVILGNTDRKRGHTKQLSGHIKQLSSQKNQTIMWLQQVDVSTQLLALARKVDQDLLHPTLNAFEEFDAGNSFHVPGNGQGPLIKSFKEAAALRLDNLETLELPLNNFRSLGTTSSLCHLLKDMYVKMPTERFEDKAGRELSYIWNVFHGFRQGHSNDHSTSQEWVDDLNDYDVSIEWNDESDDNDEWVDESKGHDDSKGKNGDGTSLDRNSELKGHGSNGQSEQAQKHVVESLSNVPAIVVMIEPQDFRGQLA